MEYFIDDHTILIGKVAIVKERTATDRGTKIDDHYEVTDLSIVTYIESMDYDVTSCMSEKQMQYFRERFLDLYKSSL